LDARDTVLGEERGGSGEESGAGVGLLVRVDLGVGQAGVVIDGGVHVLVADSGRAAVAGVVAVFSAQHTPATPVA
jgi:hypothetical protein